MFSIEHEESEVGVSSEIISLFLNVVTVLLTIARADGNVAVWRLISLAPDDGGTSWELWELHVVETSHFVELIGEWLLLGELISSHESTVAIKLSIVGINNSFSNTSEAPSGGGSLFGNLLSKGSELITSC